MHTVLFDGIDNNRVLIENSRQGNSPLFNKSVLRGNCMAVIIYNG